MAIHDSKEYQHYFTLLTHQATILDQKPWGSRRVNMHDLLPDTSNVEIIEETPLDEDALQAFKSSQERPATSAVDGVTRKALSTDDQNYFKLISRAGRQAILQNVMGKDGSKARKTFLTKQISNESQDDLQDDHEDEPSVNNDESIDVNKSSQGTPGDIVGIMSIELRNSLSKLEIPDQ